jgi:soluble lytic murein transglycosylase
MKNYRYFTKKALLFFLTIHLALVVSAFSSENLLLDALMLMSQNRYEEALKILYQISEGGNEKQKGRAYFLMGKIIKKQERPQEAAESFEKALALYPVLSDYIRFELAYLYSSSGEFDKALQMTQAIESPALYKQTQLLKIDALDSLEREDEAISALLEYTQRYDRDKEQQFRLAMLYKGQGKTEKAIEVLKDIYIAARGLSLQSLNALKALNFKEFTVDELIRRGDNLLKMAAFKAAESTYKKALTMASARKKDEVLFALGMCQFRTKKYVQSTRTFGFLSGPEPLFWRARSLYRTDNLTEYKKVLDQYGIKYNSHNRYGFLLLAYAQELMRRRSFEEARKYLKKVADNFSSHSEEALWSLGWSHYKDKDFKNAAEYFSRLTSQVKGENLPRYLYWEARSLEKIHGHSQSVYMKLANNPGYYGFLARVRLGMNETPLRVELTPPSQPDRKPYNVIEELRFLTMTDEMESEINHAVDSARTSEELIYLAYESLKINNYPQSISISFKLTGNESLFLAYPKGFWSIVQREARRQGIDPYLVLAIIREESRFNPRAISPAGARGLMQLMPSTAQREKSKAQVTIRSKADLLIPEKNIKLGIVHLKSVLAYYNNHKPLAIASYNAGKVPVNMWRERSQHKSLDEFIEDISYRETRRYVKTVLHSYWQYGKISGNPPKQKVLNEITGPWVR